ncbi:hypothetical protein ANCCAN_15697 [Ancylostoma caninum]|uniref:Uncharacterized protein n=1 Tax=Ancylostoma caninum TaxID=29170 RepID=A0A368G1Q3_ANCCA|nr:hypothetical protein ANCCAN_15697 [Ancylostoma caninum]
MNLQQNTKISYVQRLSRTKEPRCLFQMDIPCNMTAIQRSAHYTITFSKKPNNSCVIDNGGHNQILCACSQEDYCSSHCGYIVVSFTYFSRDFGLK